jgi:predicted aminopeptidase
MEPSLPHAMTRSRNPRPVPVAGLPTAVRALRKILRRLPSMGSPGGAMRALMLALALPLAGCSAVEFYWQGLSGQLDLLARARPIAEVVQDTPDAALKAKLARVQDVRAFASRELALPDNRSYTRYADLGRAYVVWNVFAAPELSLAARQWCFPVAGCVAYRGYFAEAQARSEAARLAAEGYDVHVSGVPAYSTLGWFDDAVLSTFIRYRDAEVARLVFHELAHQVVYVKDDTSFNESFAVAVEEAGLARWQAAQSGSADAAQFSQDVVRMQRLRSEFRALIRGARDRLAALYASDLPDAEKRVRKAAIFTDMRAENDRVKAAWDGAPVFDRWFAGGANNAGIISAGLYADRVPQFAALLAEEGGDLPRFYERVKELAAMPKAERDRMLAAVSDPYDVTTSTVAAPRH